MIDKCPHCDSVINLSEKQLDKIEEAFAKLAEGHVLKFNCLVCNEKIVLGPKLPPPQTQTTEALPPPEKNKFSVYEFRTVYIEVDSVIGDEPVAKSFNISPLKELGKLGWDVVAVVPRTYGQTFLNKQVIAITPIQTFGAAFGGNVIGVHIIMRRCAI
jgi:hypothetical protein